MSSRWFMSHARQDAEVGAVAGSGPQPTSATFTCSLHPDQPSKIPGPQLRVAGPGDVTAIDQSLILREEPPPGTTNAADNILVGVEFAHADLPWLLSTRQQAGGGGLQALPWVVLVVLGEDEADPPRPADPVPLLDVRPDLLPPLDESWAWAHVEARLDDGITDPNVATDAAAKAVTTPTPAVVGRLLCARRLRPQLTYAAAVVPVPAEGAWPAPAPGATTIALPVFHWWSFHTDAAGTFKDLALRIKPNTTDTGTGSPVDVSRPWPALPAGTAATTVLDGALLPSTGGAAAETWSNTGAQNAFRGQLQDELNAPDARRTPPANGAPAPTITGHRGRSAAVRQPLHSGQNDRPGGRLDAHAQPRGAPPRRRRAGRPLRAGRARIPDGAGLGASRGGAQRQPHARRRRTRHRQPPSARANQTLATRSRPPTWSPRWRRWPTG